MSYPEPRTLIFDWDNTLVDTWEAIHHALTVTFESMGMEPWTLDQTRAQVRRSAREAFPALFGDRSDAATGIFYKTFERDHLELLRPASGAAQMLEALADAGYDLAVVSNKTGGYLRAEAAQLGWDRHFRRIIGANDAPKDKPAPDAVALALEDSPVSRTGSPEVWFVGDTDIDLECAHNSGCYPVLLRAVPPGKTEFRAAPPALHLDSCRALAELLLKTH